MNDNDRVAPFGLLRWTLVMLAALMPIVAGSIVGTVGDPFSLEFSDQQNTVMWIASSLAMFAPVGFATWLVWRFPVTRNRWKRFVVAVTLFAAPCLLTNCIVERVSLVVQLENFEALDPSVSLLPGGNVVDDARPDTLFFLSLVLVLSVARQLMSTSLLPENESARGQTRWSIRSMLGLTLMVSLILVVVTHEIQENRDRLAELDLSHEGFTWMDVLGIVTPLSSAMATAVAVCLLAFTSRQKVCRSVLYVILAFCMLLAPSVLERQAFHWIEFSPTGSSILPHYFNVVGALSMLAVCAACVWVMQSKRDLAIISFKGREQLNL